MADLEYAELDIGLRRDGQDGYEVELRYVDPEGSTDLAPVRGRCCLDVPDLCAWVDERGGTGRKLTEQLFADPQISRFFAEARSQADKDSRCIRLRLLIDPEAGELHAIPWELLADPATRSALSHSERLIFSRFLWSSDWRQVELRARTSLRALVVVSSPENVADYRLTPIDTESEICRAVQALEGVEVAVLGRERAASLDNLIDALRENVDILYLVCHGAVLAANRSNRPEDFEAGYGEQASQAVERGLLLPYLFLEKELGEGDGARRLVDRVSGGTLARRLGDLPALPRLAVLVSCESAGRERSAAVYQSSLAPRLARAGVPAILAMQDKISVATAERMMPRFFRELLQDGRIDRALAAARSAVSEQEDAWIPALFLRLKGGRLWYDGGFGERDEAAIKTWKGLSTAYENCTLLPVVGWGLADQIYGSKCDIASRIAAAQHVPVSSAAAFDLHLVSQYLLVSQRSSEFAVQALKQQMRQIVYSRHRHTMAPEFRDASLGALLREAGRIHRERNRNMDALSLVADLPAPVLINASPDNLLVEALKAKGKEPVVQYALWRHDSVAEFDAITPTVQRPIVFHIFGYFANESSLVLTEDDHLEHLMGMGLNSELIPSVVKKALIEHSLFFLGFQLTDWTFRALFRMVTALLGGSARQKLKTHVGVQIEPGCLYADEDESRNYLKSYWCDIAQIPVFWGTCEEFLQELRSRAGPVKVKAQAADDF